MGIATLIKNYLISTYPECFLTPEMVNEEDIRTPPVVIIDFTYVTKYFPELATGEEFYKHQFVPQFEKFFKSGAKMVFLVFDTGSPPNKYEEHEKRYGKLIKAETPRSPKDIMKMCHPQAENFFEKRIESFVAYERENLKKNQFTDRYDTDDIENLLKDRNSKNYENILTNLSNSDPAVLLLFTDEVFPSKLYAQSAMANNQLRKEFMHYVSQKLIFDETDQKTLYSSGVYKKPFSRTTLRGFTPPLNCVLCVHGAKMSKPHRDGSQTPSDDHLYVIKNALISENNSGSVFDFENPSRDNCNMLLKSKRSVETADFDHPPEILKKLGEGELTCKYYSLKHMYEDQLIVTGDGDLIPICLLASRYRLDATKLNFSNNLFLLLKNRELKTKKKPAVKDRLKNLQNHSGDLFVDVNKLYREVTQRGPLAECEDATATLAAITVLVKSDFIKNFGQGIKGCSSATQTPWMMFPFLECPETYAKMIVVRSADIHIPWYGKPHLDAGMAVRNSFLFSKKSNDQHDKFTTGEANVANDILEKMKKVKVEVDPELFYRYVCHVYVAKYGSTKVMQNMISKRIASLEIFAAHNDETLDPEYKLKIKVDCVREHLSKSKSNSMMSKEEILSYSRRVTWVLDYWLNSYRGDCTYMNPTETYNGLSVHGWLKSNDGTFSCRSTAKVSPINPYDSFLNRNEYPSSFDGLVEFSKPTEKKNVFSESESAPSIPEIIKSVVAGTATTKNKTSVAKKLTYEECATDALADSAEQLLYLEDMEESGSTENDRIRKSNKPEKKNAGKKRKLEIIEVPSKTSKKKSPEKKRRLHEKYLEERQLRHDAIAKTQKQKQSARKAKK